MNLYLLSQPRLKPYEVCQIFEATVKKTLQFLSMHRGTRDKPVFRWMSGKLSVMV